MQSARMMRLSQLFENRPHSRVVDGEGLGIRSCAQMHTHTY